MKKSFVLILFGFGLLLQSRAQTPQPIRGYAHEQHPISWYQEQSTAWRKVIDKNPTDAKAWYNYYYANRILNYQNHDDKRTPEQKQSDINKLIDEMGTRIPESYEYNLCKWMAGGFDLSLLPYLNKAAALGEGRTEHIDFMVNMGEINRNIQERERWSLRKFEAGMISTGMMYYNYNVLVSLGNNAILITTGDNDTYPIWALQAMGIRKDVTVINTSLINLTEYRNKLFNELGVAKLDTYTGSNNDSSQAAEKAFNSKLIRHLSVNKKKAPVYMALTAAWCKNIVEPVEDNLYLVGLAYLYSNESIDNMALLRKSMEQEFALDYLDKSFYPERSKGMVDHINENYVVPMLKLYEHYKVSGDTQRQQWIKSKLLIVARNTEEEKNVLERLNRP